MATTTTKNVWQGTHKKAQMTSSSMSLGLYVSFYFIQFLDCKNSTPILTAQMTIHVWA